MLRRLRKKLKKQLNGMMRRKSIA
ncbi:hypothetical protein MUY_001675 [Bacillus licheniformis WX-02]|nr:hypothetical protein MUY_001675 [Bacillus licheniformis WX-02]